MIKISNLNKSYGKHKVLENLNCNIKTNSIYGLIGANGAGKSTLLRIIADVIRKDSGAVLIDDREVEDNEKVKQKVAFLPDDLYFFPGYTMLDMAKFYQDMYKKFDLDYFKELATMLKLDVNAKVETFSKGMKRQVSLVCTLATNAEYMLFDETFDGLDPVIRNLMKKIIAKQMESKCTTIIMTSHNLRELEDICDNLGLLYKGGILFESDIDTLKTNMFKVQISLKEEFDKDTFKDLEVLSFSKTGSVAKIIIKGERENCEKLLQAKDPVILDFLPLTLEEVFIYEMEVLGYEFNQVV
ncbi:MAG: ABC transporter ATP-binding protein [Clostridia bacterium]|nr:ABC transporter ATP-binding protein [Clostridia bacterium]